MYQLLPGDVLLYPPKSILGWVIAIKTWEKVSHVEVYVGDELSVASRDGLGVNMYATRKDYSVVLRPTGTFNLGKALAYFDTVRGQSYDWMGLLVFTLAVHQGSAKKQFCSEFARNFMLAGNIESFNWKFLSDQVAPATFLSSLAYSRL